MHDKAAAGWIEDLLLAGRSFFDPNPERSRVNGLVHSLQTATRALRENAREPDVVMALVHDAARPLSDAYHGEVIAEIMRSRLPRLHVEALRHHGEFQFDITHDTATTSSYRFQPWFPLALRLAKWDADSFDPEYQTEPLARFVPILANACEAGMEFD